MAAPMIINSRREGGGRGQGRGQGRGGGVGGIAVFVNASPTARKF